MKLVDLITLITVVLIMFSGFIFISQESIEDIDKLNNTTDLGDNSTDTSFIAQDLFQIVAYPISYLPYGFLIIFIIIAVRSWTS